MSNKFHQKQDGEILIRISRSEHFCSYIRIINRFYNPYRWYSKRLSPVLALTYVRSFRYVIFSYTWAEFGWSESTSKRFISFIWNEFLAFRHRYNYLHSYWNTQVDQLKPRDLVIANVCELTSTNQRFPIKLQALIMSLIFDELTPIEHKLEETCF